MANHSNIYPPVSHQRLFASAQGAEFHVDMETIPEIIGAYAVILRLERSISVRVGRLGMCRFGAGLYGYAGNAYGPGGLSSRLRRHFKRHVRRHWHIDYLKPSARPLGAWVFENGQECEITEAMLSLANASVPVPGFGASDCRQCLSHLVRFDP